MLILTLVSFQLMFASAPALAVSRRADAPPAPAACAMCGGPCCCPETCAKASDRPACGASHCAIGAVPASIRFVLDADGFVTATVGLTASPPPAVERRSGFAPRLAAAQPFSGALLRPPCALA